MHVPPRWVTCPHCGEKRDASGRYTSPANAAKDEADWSREHLSGACAPSTTSPTT